MYWQVSLALFTIQEFGSFQVLGCIMYVENTFSMGGPIFGDNGYMLRPYLLTPYRQPTSTPQSIYNYAHKRTRVIFQQTFGRWKRRFHCLHGELRMNPDIICSIIVSCAVLHNIAIQWKQPLLEDEVPDDSYSNDVLDFEETAGHLASRHYRNQFSIRNFRN